MLAAEIDKFLRFSNTPDERAREAATLEQKAKGRDGIGLVRCADEVRLPSGRSSCRYALMSCSAETASRIKSNLPECLLISLAFREMIASSAPRRGGKDHDMDPKRMGKLYRHVAQAAKTHHTDLFGFSDTTHATWASMSITNQLGLKEGDKLL